MSFSLPPLATAAERLMLDIERAVRQFPRYHRYTAGEELRTQAFEVTRLVQRAWRAKREQDEDLPDLCPNCGEKCPRARNEQVEHIQNLRRAIDDLKIRLQLCSLLHAFGGGGQYNALARQARDLGRQAGGWYRQQTRKHPNGQNVQGGAVAQRAKKLSTRDTSQWEVYRT